MSIVRIITIIKRRHKNGAKIIIITNGGEAEQRAGDAEPHDRRTTREDSVDQHQGGQCGPAPLNLPRSNRREPYPERRAGPRQSVGQRAAARSGAAWRLLGSRAGVPTAERGVTAAQRRLERTTAPRQAGGVEGRPGVQRSAVRRLKGSSVRKAATWQRGCAQSASRGGSLTTGLREMVCGRRSDGMQEAAGPAHRTDTQHFE